jgi:hypothetical protein
MARSSLSSQRTGYRVPGAEESLSGVPVPGARRPVPVREAVLPERDVLVHQRGE